MNASVIQNSPEIRAGLHKMAADLLNSDGSLKIVNSSYYDQFDQQVIKLFCHQFTRYLLPTIELVDCLKLLIGGRTSLEIGSGCGDLGRSLSIRMTDSYNQEFPEVKQYYQMMGQPTITYGKDVERLNALEAIEKYNPEVVIGAWVTQWIDPNLPPPPGGGNMYGIKEDILLSKVKSYIMVGSEKVHWSKKILNHPHDSIDARSFVRSRNTDNKIWIWNPNN